MRENIGIVIKKEMSALHFPLVCIRVSEVWTSLFDYLLLRIASAHASISIPHIHDMTALSTVPSDCVSPATTNVRNDTPATVRAYGSCDDT